jgi:DNA-binding transcriptional MerR regulator
MSSEDSPSWSIDELAALAGVPTRTLREYRTMGVIDPPRRQGRVGRYDESHRRRLELVARLQERGYSLAAIRDLCTASASGSTLEDVLGGVAAGAIDDGAVALSTDALERAVPAMAESTVRRVAVDAGLVFPDGDGWVVRAPALLSLVGDAVAAGADPLAAVRLAAGLRDGARMQAQAFADFVVDQLWDDGAPATEVLATLGRRARVHLTRAVASLIAHEVGVELRDRATKPGGAGLDELVDLLRVGVVRGREG